MSHITSLHHYLDKIFDMRIGELREIITRNPSSINEVKMCNFYKNTPATPLIKVLMNWRCTVDFIKLLLDHRADINFEENSPLMVALEHCTDEKVIAMLLGNGAKVDVHKDFYSPLCVALRRRASKHVIQLLLDAGCSVHACKKHASSVHCFCHSQQWGIREDVLKLIIKAGAEVSKLDANGQSPMCLALCFGAGPNDIELLMRVGVSLNACGKHPSPLHCLVGDHNHCQRPLVRDVVKSLLDAGASFETVIENDSKLLHEILCNCRYENEAIRLLLDVPGVDVNGVDRHGETLLHCAVMNFFCPMSVLKLLLDKGAEVGKLNANGEAALDVAIRYSKPLKVINFLLKKGSPINTQDLTTSRPLKIAVDCETIMTLLIAGARIGRNLDLIKEPLSRWIRMRQEFTFSSKALDCIKCLVKCYILEYSEFHVKDLTLIHSICNYLQGFAEECKLELGQMESESAGHGRTVQQLISRKSPPPRTVAASCMMEGKDFDFNWLLETLSRNVFPLYFDIISANVGKESMEKKLREVPVYTVIDCPDSPCTGKKVTLNYDVVCKIAGLLSDAELLKLILAFDKQENHTGSKRCNEEQDVEEPGPSYSEKRPKLG